MWRRPPGAVHSARREAFLQGAGWGEPLVNVVKWMSFLAVNWERTAFFCIFVAKPLTSKTKSMKKFLLIAVMLLLFMPALAQQRDKALTIEVKTVAGTAVTDATLKLTQTDYSVSYGTLKLNAQGRVTVKVYAGNHRLEVSKAGYNGEVRTFEVLNDTTVSVSLQEQTQLPFSLGVTVDHDAQSGLNDVTFKWNQEPPVFFDDFESYEPFAIEFGDWTGIDNDGLIAAPLVGEYANRGVKQYAQIMNPMTVEPSWWYDYPILRPYSGLQYAGFTRTFSGAANDDWLISPVITPGNQNSLTFRGKAADQYKERFQVYVTTVTDNPQMSDFVKINIGNYETADYTGWRVYTYDLAAYAGKPIRFAIRYISEANVTGGFMLMVDDVLVGQVYDNAAQAIAKARAQRVAAKSPMNPNESFKVYLNGVEHGQTEDYEYVFTGLDAGTYTLGVQAVYIDSQTEIADTTIVIADTNSRLTVQVSTNNGLSLDGNAVEATEKATATVYRAVIADNEAVFNSLPNGDYTVGINATNYDVCEQELTLSDDMTIQMLVKETIVDPYNITVDVSRYGRDNSDVTARWNQNLSFKDSFEDYPDFARGSFGGWKTVDLDQRNVYPISLNGYIVNYPGASTQSNPLPVPPLVFNPWHTTPPMLPTDQAVAAPTGDKTIIFFSPQLSGANKWLISPELTIREGFVCRFLAKAYDNYPESMEVCVFTDGNSNPSNLDYDVVATIDNMPAGQWLQYEVDLSAYVEQSVRVAVHYTSYDAFFVQLDDFYVGAQQEGGTVDVGAVKRYVVYLDGDSMTTVTEPQVVLNRVADGHHTLGIKAVYASGESAVVTYEFDIDQESLVGDVNGDGEVSVADVTSLVALLMDQSQNARSDVNDDGETSVADLTALVNILLRQ